MSFHLPFYLNQRFCPHHSAKINLVKINNDLHLYTSNVQFSGPILHWRQAITPSLNTVTTWLQALAFSWLTSDFTGSSSSLSIAHSPSYVHPLNTGLSRLSSQLLSTLFVNFFLTIIYISIYSLNFSPLISTYPFNCMFNISFWMSNRYLTLSKSNIELPISSSLFPNSSPRSLPSYC